MSKIIFRCTKHVIFSVIICILIATGIFAQQIDFDLLLGIGDFEKCSYSQILGGEQYGEIPTANLSVANGWEAAINQTYKYNYVYKIVNSSNFTGTGSNFLEAGKSYQYISVSTTTTSQMACQL
ncbi:hypothetical protein MEO93_27610, partial [Dolichospermum sp. ST_sed3]|nr:hypothetical protein [Dolichospermum sp. ST_sed3]